MIKQVITDVDGVLTTGRFFYDEHGKRLKEFGPHDSDGVKLLAAMGVGVRAITADLRGWRITKKRLDDMGVPVTRVSEEIRSTFLTQFNPETTVYVGDGYHDVEGLQRFPYSFAPADACEVARNAAGKVLNTNGGQGVLLEVALRIQRMLERPPVDRISNILRELRGVHVDDGPYYLAAEYIARYGFDGQVIGIAAGRMGFSLRAFIMRLAHLGARAYMWGDPGITAVNERTLVIVNSSSGETPTVKLLAQQAKDRGARIVLVTNTPTSSIGNLANVKLPYHTTEASAQPMKTLFEQFTFILFDALILDIAEKCKQDWPTITKNHSSLE